MSEQRNVQRANPADIKAVMDARAKRSQPFVSLASPDDGSHVWAASGLSGFAAGTPAQMWSRSGLRDAFADLKAAHGTPGDWVGPMAAALRERR